jgi:hypothetical protein
VCTFLGIEDQTVPRGIALPRNQSAYALPFLWFIHSMNRRGTNYDPTTGLVTARPGAIGWTTRQLALLGSRLSAATRIFVREQEPAVSYQTRAALLDFYLPHIVKLESITKVDLSAWKVLHPLRREGEQPPELRRT